MRDQYDDALERIRQLNDETQSVDSLVLLRAAFLQSEILFSLYRRYGYSKEVVMSPSLPRSGFKSTFSPCSARSSPSSLGKSPFPLS